MRILEGEQAGNWTSYTFASPRLVLQAMCHVLQLAKLKMKLKRKPARDSVTYIYKNNYFLPSSYNAYFRR